MTFKLTALISFPQMPVSDSLSAVHDCSRLNKGYNTLEINSILKSGNEEDINNFLELDYQ